MQQYMKLSMLALGACITATVTSAPDAQITLAPAAPDSESADLAVVSSYKALFSNWNLEAKRHVPRGPSLCTLCSCCLRCCPAGNWLVAPTSIDAPSTTTAEAITTSNVSHTDSKPQVTPARLADLGQHSAKESCNCYLDPECCAQDTAVPTSTPQPPATASVLPTRTTIYRHALQTPPSKQAPAPAPGSDITESYYDFSLEGHHPNVIPLILEDASDEPVTVLSFGNTTTRANFISASLVAQLNLTRFVDAAGQDTAAVQPVLGAGVESTGSIDLNVLAGRQDRKFFGVSFNVFEDASSVTAEEAWQADVIVGLDFLNRGAALRLSDEYLGVGVRSGLGVVVQRVMVPFHDSQTNGGQLGTENGRQIHGIGQGIVHEEL